jgi:glycosyltransferase involved in cell wall biosynthesis
MLPLVFLSLLTIYYIGAMLYLQRGLRSLKPSGNPHHSTYSIVIVARNEEANIVRCLDGIFSQTATPCFEVIVVDDRSTDATGRLCARYAKHHPMMSVITVVSTPDGTAPKTDAIVAGIEAARYKIIVRTDADCVVGPEWLATIDRNFADDTRLVQGIKTHAWPEGMNRVFYGLQAVGCLSCGIAAALAIGAGLPARAIAGNFAFRREAFEADNGHGGSPAGVVSGDDYLPLKCAARSGTGKVRFMADPLGAVRTATTHPAKDFFEQCKRGGPKRANHTIGQAAFLGGIFLFYCEIFYTFYLGFITPFFFAVCAGMFAAKVAGEFLLLIPGSALFNQKPLRPFILPASVMQLPVVAAAMALGVFGRFPWRGERFGREVN